MRTRYLIEILIIIGASFPLVAGLGLYSSVRPPKSASTVTPADFGLSYEQVNLLTDDGIKIAGWFIPRRGGEDGATVIALHGYPADKGDILPHVATLAERYNLLLVDFRYFGQSGGRYTTAGAREVKDLAAAVRYLKSRGQDKIGIYGFSMGGAVALMGVGLDADVRAVVAEAAYADLHGMIVDLWRNFGPLRAPFVGATELLARALFGIDVKSVSPAAAVAGTQKPVLLIHAFDDRVIPFQNALTIQNALVNDANAEFWFIDVGGHGAPQKEFDRRVGDFFAEYLRQ